MLKLDHHFFEPLLRTATEGVVVQDSAGRIVFCNPAAHRMLGIGEGDIGSTPGDLGIEAVREDGTPFPIDERPGIVALRSGQPSSGVIMGFDHKPVGRRIWISVTTTPLPATSRRGLMVFSVFADVTARIDTHRHMRKVEGQLRAVLQAIPDMVWLKDVNGVYLACNAEFGRYFGADPADIVGKTDREFLAAEDADYSLALDRKATQAETPLVYERWLAYANDGHRALKESIKTRMLDDRGNIIGILGIARDITGRKQAEEELRIAAAAFETQEGIVVADAYMKILRVNRAFSRITGFSAPDVVGQSLDMLRSDLHSTTFYDQMNIDVAMRGSWAGDIWNTCKGGGAFPCWGTITAVPGESGVITHYVVTMLDLTNQKAAEAEIRQLALYDQLTSLPNRRNLLDRMELTIAASARSGREGAVLFIDLDNFKKLNDGFGHDVGDMLLREVARRLGTCVRKTDTVARQGGDEFVVMLVDLSADRVEAATQAKAVAEKILEALFEPYTLSGRQHQSAASIGVTLLNTAPGSAVDEVLKRADMAMYEAKSAGRNTLRFFETDMQELVTAHSALQAEIRQALLENDFVLHYQPQVNQAGNVTGAEALVRWRHPTRGLLSPAEFLPLAEETGQILALGKWVLEAACAQLQLWSARPELEQLTLAVNISPRQFRQVDFVAQVAASMQKFATPVQRLKLELTERVVFENVEDTVAKMGALIPMGVGFSIDDFGTGYSSLAMLTRLPLNDIKIDQSFVCHLPEDPGDAMVVQTTITMARNLGLGVIAEGVETEAQRLFLHRYGCPTFQGYLFSHPVGLAEFEELLGGRVPVAMEK